MKHAGTTPTVQTETAQDEQWGVFDILASLLFILLKFYESLESAVCFLLINAWNMNM